jgi:hypothetical protein
MRGIIIFVYALIVNPEDDDPEQFFSYNEFVQIESAPDSPDAAKGEATIEACQLSRHDLTARLDELVNGSAKYPEIPCLKEMEQTISDQIHQYDSTVDDAKKTELRENIRDAIHEIKELASPHMPYAGCIRYFLKKIKQRFIEIVGE